MMKYGYYQLAFIVGLCVTSTANAQKAALTPDELPELMVINEQDDWVQLHSGETLKGELIGTVEHSQGSYDQTIEFDSDDLGDQEIDLEDISRLKTASPFRVLLNSGKVYRGYLAINGDTLIISGYKSIEIPKVQVVSIYRGVETEFERWSTDLFLGANISKGNTDELAISANIEAERKTVKSRVQLRYTGNLAETSGEKTAQNHLVDGSYDINLTPRFFYRPIKMTIDSDKFQNIDYRINASMQLGYFLFAESDFEWDVSIGPGFQYTRFETVQEGEPVDDNSPTILMSSKMEYEVTDTIDLSHTYDLNWSMTSTGGVRHTNNIGFDIEMIEDLDFSIKLVWDHQSNPTASADGTEPKKDDYRLNFGITFDF